MAASRSFQALVAEFYELAATELAAEIPGMPCETPGQMALHLAFAFDLQVRLARTLARLDVPARQREVRLVLKGEEDRAVRFWFEDGADMLHAEPVLDDMTNAPRSSLLVKQTLAPEHFTHIAQAGVQMLIDCFGASYRAEIDVVAPLAPDFEEAAVMALIEGRSRSPAGDGYEPGEECDPDFAALYEAIQGVLWPLAEESPFPGGDYYLVEDDYGHRQQKIEIEKWELLHPDVVHALRKLLDGFPRWEIVIAAGQEGGPPMGLTIRKDEIIDGLLRAYLPPECRSFQYEGARPGTEND